MSDPTDDATKLRQVAQLLDAVDARRGGDQSDEMQTDLRRIAMNIELGRYPKT
jgi:hypothetical protein